MEPQLQNRRSNPAIKCRTTSAETKFEIRDYKLEGKGSSALKEQKEIWKNLHASQNLVFQEKFPNIEDL